MTGPLFAYPPKAQFNRVVPKTKIYEHAQPSRGLRERFVREVEQVIWQYKLSPETTNLAARDGVSEIQVFVIQLKSGEVSEAVLRCLDKAISFPTFFELIHGDRVKSTAAFKRPSEAEADKWVVDGYFETPWHGAAEPRVPLPVALDLGGLYEAMLLSHIGLTRRDGETLRELVARAHVIRTKEAECRRLESRLLQEHQFNRRVDLNGLLRAAQRELKELRG